MLHRQPNKTGQVNSQTTQKCDARWGLLLCCGLRRNVCIFRYIFLFDKVVIVCKRKGYSYELKEIIELQSYKMSDDPMNNRDMKKVRACLGEKRETMTQIDCVCCEIAATSSGAGNESSCVFIVNVALPLKALVDASFRYTVEPGNDAFKYLPCIFACLSGHVNAAKVI